jgi:hypothetical protein
MTVTIVSGIPPGPSGTGRFMTYLAQAGFHLVAGDQFEVSPITLLRQRRFLQTANVVGRHLWRQLKVTAFLHWARHRDDIDLIVMHPQSLGMQRTMRLLESRKRTWLYLLDSSFFCIRSYNFRAGQDAPCLACLGNSGDGVAQYGCKTWPTAEAYAHEYVVRLRRLVADGRVGVFAQNPTQAKLASKHFGVPIEPFGLWTADWDDCFVPAIAQKQGAGAFDVVFHGMQVEAKGALWINRVAELCPDLTFLMPFARPLGFAPLANCNYQPMNWETGLRDAVESAPITVLPSLWSASIEGALVKSLVVGRAVAVCENESAFAADLPAGLALVLPRDVAAAAQVLRDAVGAGWRPEAKLKSDWVKRFHAENFATADRLRLAAQSSLRWQKSRVPESLGAS